MPLPDVFLGRPSADVEINDALAMVVFLEADGKIYFGTLSAYDNTNTRLGIGTTSPSHALHVLAAAAVRALVETTAATNADLAVKNSARTWIFRCSGAGNFAFIDGNTAAFPLFIAAGAPSAAIAIDAGGRVGLGTTTPDASAKLDVPGLVYLGRMTTAQITALGAVNPGAIVYDTTTGTFKGRTFLFGGSWSVLG